MFFRTFKLIRIVELHCNWVLLKKRMIRSICFSLGKTRENGYQLIPKALNTGGIAWGAKHKNKQYSLNSSNQMNFDEIILRGDKDDKFLAREG